MIPNTLEEWFDSNHNIIGKPSRLRKVEFLLKHAYEEQGKHRELSPMWYDWQRSIDKYRVEYVCLTGRSFEDDHDISLKGGGILNVRNEQEEKDRK